MPKQDFISIEDFCSSAGVYPRWLNVHLKRLLGIRNINSVKNKLSLVNLGEEGPTDRGVYTKILEALGFEFEVESPSFEWPAPGTPLLLVANHPMGGIEGIVLVALALSRRPDTRFLYSSFLGQIEGVGDTLLPISSGGDSAGRELNRNSMREAIRHLSSGGCLAMFPGGDPHMRGVMRRKHESTWSPHAGDLAKKSGAVVLPVCFGLWPSPPLSWVGGIRSKMRPLVWSTRLAGQKGRKIHVAMGWLIPSPVLKSFSDRSVCSDFLLLASRVCGEQYGLLPKKFSILQGVWDRFSTENDLKPQILLAPAVNPGSIAAELSSLPSESMIQMEGDFQMFYVRAVDIPHTLREVGRLREYSFRAIGEGTGKALDLDEFDEYYTHLLVWDRSRQRLVGAYRMGRALPNRKRYVETLFQISNPLIRHLSNALELGRSFITAEYQVHSGVLNLMWKGIAKVVAQNPEHPLLYGPVSISGHFHPVSRALILYYLKQNHFDTRNARFVRAPVPPKLHRKQLGVDLECIARGIRSMDQLSALVSVLEKDGKGVPPLIKHYTRLGGRFLSFGVDEHFGNAVDGLLLLDLRNTPFALLKRFMGETVAKSFVKQHQG
ncbi:MAG: GNAT family N-acetyltransferase [Sphingomonadales bacterium]|nr:GNAT family N-acetyltransferase [Sphingomonadales bacterium]